MTSGGPAWTTAPGIGARPRGAADQLPATVNTRSQPTPARPGLALASVPGSPSYRLDGGRLCRPFALIAPSAPVAIAAPP